MHGMTAAAPAAATLLFVVAVVATNVAGFDPFRNHLDRSLHQVETPPAIPPAPPLTAAPIPYDWSLGPVTTPDQDAPRYQAQLNTLLATPLSDWQEFPAVSSWRFGR